jgi:asparagine synthetase B (glutamine-hydrolysing)
MQSFSNNKVNTFTIGFNAKEFDEAKHAGMVAKHLGTNHFEKYVTEGDALDVIPNIPYIYDEPFADSSQIPTYLVSKFAKEKVTVALSGDAGDELFGGYNRYVYGGKMFNKVVKAPIFIKKLMSQKKSGTAYWEGWLTNVLLILVINSTKLGMFFLLNQYVIYILN